MKFDELEIMEDDFDLFILLDEPNKIEYLHDTAILGPRGAMLKQIAKIEDMKQESMGMAHVQDVLVSGHRLCITTYDDVITFNSESLSVINKCIKNIWLDGHIMTRDHDVVKTSLDIYKYFKAFSIIKLSMPICEN
jgi:hypothetical protein|tara:strand:- start:16342 stop:16749 length:408 start_codon:yes stop_codon:yes gene_type:complete